VLRALDDALRAHELVKGRMRAPEDKRALAAELARATGAALAGVIGHTAILYRARPDDPALELP
jgi:RNA-binding protein